MRGFTAELPDAQRPRASVSLRQRSEVFIRFLHQKRSARRRAAAADTSSFDEHHVHAGFREAPGDGRAGHAAADDGNVGLKIASQ